MPTSRVTPLGIMVLALLREGDTHPYEMSRVLRHRRDDRLVAITHGTLYHTVARLEKQGLLAEVGVDRDGNRPERRTYTLTEAGRDCVADWVRRELVRIDRPAEFRVALAEAHNLDAAEAARLLRERRRLLADDDAAHREGLGQARERGVPEQFLVEIDRQSILLAAELEWLDTLIHRIESGSVPWGVDDLDPHAKDALVSETRALLA